MKYHECITEAIQTRPRNWQLYLNNRIKELDRLLTMSQEARQLAKQYERDGYDVLRSSLRYGSNDYETSNDLYLLSDTNLNNSYRIEDVKYSLETLLTYGPKDFLRYVMSNLDTLRPVDREYRETASKLPFAEAGLIQYGYEEGNPEHVADPEYIAAKHLLRACRMNVAIVTRIEPLYDDLRLKLGAVAHMVNSPHQYNPEKYRPEHEEVETLYHATAYVKEILKDGFSAEKPEGRTGVGNFGHQDLISFTYDIEIARTIMRSFKEIWMIAHHQLTAETILHWSKVEGILDDVKKAWKGLTSDPMPTGRQADPKKTVQLYRYWLSFTKTRSNPMLVSPWEIVEMMEHRSFDDIGILVCQVRIGDNSEFRVGESEFRVRADQVLSVKQAM